jgi:diguanylate cyclase (GGDEF)-like protein/PAS domain S-box-containing protein
MHKDKTFYENLLNNLSEGVCFVDRERTITFWNEGAARITGLPAAEVVGKPCISSGRQHVDASGCVLCNDRCPFEVTLKNGKPMTSDVYLRHQNGQRVLVESRTQPMFDEGGCVVGAVELFLESSSHRGAMARLAELEQLAMNDPLTGIANRRYLDQELVARMEAFKRNDWPFGILIIDIDRFKSINDTRGHAVGDKVLKVVATTLAVNVRPFDLVGRWGGEEFLAVVTMSDTPGLLRVAERLRILVEMSWIKEATDMVRPTVSVGGAVVESGDTLESLFERADAKVYQAKRSGRNCVRV